MKDVVLIVPRVSQRHKILAGARHYVAVELDVEVAQGGVEAQVALLFRVALHPHHFALVFCADGDG